jgi:hypothetical protein
MLRTQLNTEYFQDLFDEAAEFGIEIEGHRQFLLRALLLQLLTILQILRRDLVCSKRRWRTGTRFAWQTMRSCSSLPPRA